MKRQLDYETLQEALYNLIEIKGINKHQITKASGVHNLTEIVSGKIKPAIGTWFRLRDAFPESIPEPCYIGGDVIPESTQIVGNKNRNTTLTIGHGTALSPREATIIQLLREKDKDGSLANRILAILLQD